MPFNINNISRQDKSRTTSILRQQRSSCVAVIHSYQQEDMTRLVPINFKNDQLLSNNFQKSSKGNLNVRNPLVIRQDIVRCAVTNNKGTPSGNFSLTIKRGNKIKNGVNTSDNVDYLRIIQPGDWIMIYMKKDGQIDDKDLANTKPSSGFKFLGIVENVRYLELDNPNNANPKLEILVTGQSFGKVFNTSVFFNPIVNQQTIQTILGLDYLTDSSKSKRFIDDNTADEVMRRIIRDYLGGKVVSRSSANDIWYIPQSVARVLKGQDKNKSLGKSVIDILNTKRIGIQNYNKGVLTRLTRMPGSALIKSLPSSGTIWSIMQFMQNGALNELYTEMLLDTNGTLQPGVVLRQMPFSNKPNHETNVFNAHNKYNKTNKITDFLAYNEKTYFIDLPKYDIVSSDIKQKNIGKSDHERINYVIVVPKIDNVNFDILYTAGSNPASIQRYGLKAFQAQTSYVMSPNTDGVKNYCSRAVSLLQDWFFLSHNLYNGTIITDGRNDFVEIGNNLYISDIKQLFHIEGYTHTFQISPTGDPLYETEFRVSRGQFFDPSGSKAAFISSNTDINDVTTVVTSFVPRSNEK